MGNFRCRLGHIRRAVVLFRGSSHRRGGARSDRSRIGVAAAGRGGGVGGCRSGGLGRRHVGAGELGHGGTGDAPCRRGATATPASTSAATPASTSPTTEKSSSRGDSGRIRLRRWTCATPGSHDQPRSNPEYGSAGVGNAVSTAPSIISEVIVSEQAHPSVYNLATEGAALVRNCDRIRTA
jgi:hypothetical protein